MGEIYICHHLGMGDHIICNGLVRTVQKRENERVFLFSYENNSKRVRRMFSDNPNIVIISIPPFPKFEDQILYISKYLRQNRAERLLWLGFENMGLYPSLNFDEIFYRLANVPFECRWSEFFFPRNDSNELSTINELNPSGEPFMFVHDDPSRGFEFTPENPKNLKIIRNNPKIDIFDMALLLERAEEIHCMESSFKCLIEGLPEVKCPLYFHRNVRLNTSLPAISIGKKRWIVVE